MIGNDQVANFADFMLAFRRSRTKELPRSLFGEPSWDFLLELFVADARGVRMTGRQISERHQISPAVASRWLKHLSAEGLIIGDGSGDLDDELTLSGAAMEKIERLLQAADTAKHVRFE
jgi:DNA-binding MarR family transcriptional regulator